MLAAVEEVGDGSECAQLNCLKSNERCPCKTRFGSKFGHSEPRRSQAAATDGRVAAGYAAWHTVASNSRWIRRRARGRN